jgi:hypothetical protein
MQLSTYLLPQVYFLLHPIEAIGSAAKVPGNTETHYNTLRI